MSNNIAKIYTLSPMQESMLFHSLIEKDSASYFEQAKFEIEGEIDSTLLEKSYNKLIERYDILRTSFVHQGIAKPRQVVLKKRPVKLHIEDISAATNQEEKVAQFLENDLAEKFDLVKSNLTRIALIKKSATNSVFVWSFHHILMDGWCLGILFGELFSIYHALQKKKNPFLPPVKAYQQYINWLNKQDKKGALGFWQKYLADYSQFTELPYRNEQATNDYQLEETLVNFGTATTQKLIELAKASQTTINTVFQTIWGLLLQRYNHANDVVFGAVTSGRPAEVPGVEEMVGLFINTVPVRVAAQENQSFLDVLKAVKDSSSEAKSHEYLPLSEIQAKTELKSDLINHIVVFENYPFEDESLKQLQDMTGIAIKSSHIKEQTSYDFNLIVLPGDDLGVKFSYNQFAFNRKDIEQIGAHLQQFVEAVLQNPSVVPSQINIVTPEEKLQLTQEFNPSAADFADDKTLMDVFCEEAQKRPNDIALSFEGKTFTYAEVDRLSNQVANCLIADFAIEKEDLVGIMLERSEWMIIGIFGILKAGAAYVPIDPSNPKGRIDYIIDDSQCKVICADKKYDGISSSILNLKELGEYSEELPAVEIKPDNLAYVIYTSGSTGKPKGVLIEHRGVVNIMEGLEKLYPLQTDDTFLLKTTFTFDVSVTEIFGWFFGKGKLAILPAGYEKDPMALLDEVKKQQVTHVNFVPSMFGMLVSIIDNEQTKQKLNSLKYIFLAGEALSRDLVETFEAFNLNIQLENIYGPTESTIYGTYFSLSNYSTGLIPIGIPVQNIKAYIVDKGMNLLPVGVPGELCLSGVGLARGYLKKEELTADRFIDNPFNESGDAAHNKLYRTGDLSKWLPDGNVQYLGRLDEQVKVRGFRIEIGEIEYELGKHKDVEKCVVVAKDFGSGQKQLAAYVKLSGSNRPEVSDLHTYLSDFLPYYMIPSFFIFMDEFPLTASGKVNRKELPNPDSSAAQNNYVAPRNETEEHVVKIWQEVLGINKVGVQDNFFEIGGHSLNATQVISRINKDLSANLNLREIFSLPTVEELVQAVNGEDTQEFEHIKAVEKQEAYELSHAQRRLWVLSQFEDAGAVYNMPLPFKFTGEFNVQKLEEALAILIQRHEVLRTSIVSNNGNPQQIIHETVATPIEFVEAAEAQVEALLQEHANRVFDLSEAPLMHVRVIRISEKEHVLSLNMHHIISDGWSLNIFALELINCYNLLNQGKKPVFEALKIQYKDYAAWQTELLNDANQEMKKFWNEQFAGDVPVLDLPSDFTRPAVKTFNGKTLHFSLGNERAQQIKTFTKQEGATLFMSLLAYVKVLLHRYSNQNDIVVGSPVAGRNHADLEGQIGFYVNALALRSKVDEKETLKSLLAKVKKTASEAFNHQQYPFDKLVEELQLDRDTSRNPLFDIMVVLQNNEAPELNMDGLIVQPVELDSEISKFDITFTFTEDGSDIKLDLEFNTDIYSEERIANMFVHFTSLLDNLHQNPSAELSKISIISESEKTKIIEEFNSTAVEYPTEKTVVELFEQQVANTPNKVAVVDGRKQFTYSEINQKANGLANLLIETHKVEAEDKVAILLDNSHQYITSIFGIVKSGAAYVPIDPAYPAERINYILQQAECKALITDSEQDFEVAVIQPDSIEAKIENPTVKIEAKQLAYVIFTSGTTGRPKGVMIEHRSLTNMCFWYNNRYGVTELDNCTKYAGVGFDASVWEVFPALIKGASIHVINKETKLDAQKLNQYFNDENISVSFLPTAVCEQFLSLNNNSLRELLTGGDKLHNFTPQQYRLTNNYGPTEGTIAITCFTVDKAYSNIPIGKPIDNTKIYVLGKDNAIQPIGVPGELCVSGICLARGYMGSQEQTDQKFVQNPFAKGERMYRTGDLVQWMPDGNIQFLGRVDEQVQIRGFRIEPGEIEHHLNEYNEIDEALILAKDFGNGELELAAYLVSNAVSLDIEKLRQHLNKQLPPYMIPAYFVELDKFPLTPNGKVDRKALPKPQESAIRQEIIEPRTETEEKIAAVWKDILNTSRIGINENFFAIGGHSLKATQVVSRLNDAFSTNLSLQDIFTAPTIEELARAINQKETSQLPDILPVEKQEYYDLSHSQYRLWVLSKFQEAQASYNMPGAFRLAGKLDVEALNKAFGKLIERHEILRTSFVSINDVPKQKIQDSIAFKVEVEEVDSSKIEQKILDYSLFEFDLTKAPLLKAKLFKLADDQHILALNIHHIIGDGWSVGVVANELSGYYNTLAANNESEVPALTIQYKDFAAWQNELLKKQSEAREFWLNKFEGEIPVLELPTDFARPEFNSYKGKSIWYQFDAEISQKLKSLCAENGGTLFMGLLAGVKAVLNRYTGQDDIVVGTPIAGRNHSGLEDQIGLYLNTLALRTQIDESASFLQLLKQVKATTTEAFEHQFYPFDLLVDELKVDRNTGRNPLFDVMVIMQNNQKADIKFDGVEAELVNVPSSFSKFDMTFGFSEEFVDGKELIELNLEFNTDVYSEEKIQRLCGHLEELFRGITAKPETPLKQANILSASEKETLVHAFNDTFVSYNKELTLAQLFEEQTEKTPNKTAVICGDESLTWLELNAKANHLAEVLRSKGVQRNQVVGLYTSRSLELVIGTMAVLKAGGAYVPLDYTFPESRLQYMVENSETKIILTTFDENERLETADDILWIQIDNKKLEAKNENPVSVNSAEDLAYVIYTSGSTGKPKGVMIPHRAVHNYNIAMMKAADLNENSTILSVTTFSFDIYVTESLLPLTQGITMVLADEESQKEPKAITELILKHDIKVMQTTPSRYQLLTTDMEALGDGLRHLDRIMVGGEAFPDELFKVLKENTDARIINVYGPTETTVWSSTVDLTEREKITIGTPIANTTLFVLDKNLNMQPIGVPGELYIGGDGLAHGYHNRPELNEATFIANPLNPEERIYKTGDIVKWLPDGEVEYFGRADFQVKIRGYRIELSEIENQLLKIEAVKAAVVIAKVDGNGTYFLCAYYTSDSEIEIEAIKRALGESLPDYMVPAYYMQLDAIPMTPNGKINRKALPEPNLSGIEQEFVAPRNELEEKLAEIWKEVLGIDKVSVTANFFDLGGQSLKAIQIVSRIGKAFNTAVNLKDVFANPTIESFAAIVSKGVQKQFEAISPIEKADAYEVSNAQRRLWIIDSLENGSAAYNIPFGFFLKGKVDETVFKQAFQELVKRHEILRTYFVHNNGITQQVVLDELSVEVKSHKHNISNEVEAKVVAQKALDESASHTFSLNEAPLFFAEFHQFSDDYSAFVFVMHHIISDGWSMGVITKELNIIYNELIEKAAQTSLPVLPIQYKDYANWQNQLLAKGDLDAQLDYWKQKLGDELPVSEFPADNARPTQKTYDGAFLDFEVNEELTDIIHKIARENGCSLFMVLTALTKTLLYKYTGEKDMLLGTPIAGRNHSDLEAQIGFYVNTLVLRSELDNEQPFAEYLKHIKQVTVEAFDNQDYPFDNLVEGLGLKRDLSRNPIFETMIILQNQEDTNIDFSGVEAQLLMPELSGSKFDLTFAFAENSGRVQLQINYNTNLYQKETIERLWVHLNELVKSINAQPETNIGKLNILTADEEETLLNKFNNYPLEFPKENTLIDELAQQASATPNATALIFDTNGQDRHLTYHELHEQSNRLANYLIEAFKLQPDELVGVMMPRNEKLIISLLAVVKAGAAYVPIDPNYPQHRVSYMLKDSKAKVLLTNTDQVKLGDEPLNSSVVNVNALQLDKYASTLPSTQVTPENLAYVIYTSGSTGLPKGVAIEHRNAVSFVHWAANEFKEAFDVVYAGTSICFDLSIFELFYSLSSGKTIRLIESGLYIGNYVSKDKNILINTVPSVVKELVSQGMNWENVQVLNMAGEPIPESLIRQLADKNLVVKNLYGPSEYTTYTTNYVFEKYDEVLIGKPIANTNLYLLSEDQTLVPQGSIGELYVSGAGLARGYLYKEELTAERFLPHPFIAGERIYRTGDIGKWTRDGNINFLGRIDHQLKIRGFRIELGEIENRLQKSDAIKEAVVVAHGDDSNKELVAFFVGNQESLDVSALRVYLKQFLPDYMVPAYFVQLEVLPLTPNGKIDKKSLLNDFNPAGTDSLEYVAPATETEQIIAAVWQEVLRKEKVGTLHHFFEIGGNSINALKVVSSLGDRGIEIPLSDLFVHENIQELAAKIDELSAAEEIKELPLTPMQEWYIDANNGKLPAVYERVSLYSESEISLENLQKAVDSLVETEEILRTEIVDAKQYIHKQFELRVSETEAGNKEAAHRLMEESNFVNMQLVHLPKASCINIAINKLLADQKTLELISQKLLRLLAGNNIEKAEVPYSTWSAIASAAKVQQDESEEVWQNINDNIEPALDINLAAERRSKNCIILNAKDEVKRVYDNYGTDAQQISLVALGETLRNWTVSTNGAVMYVASSRARMHAENIVGTCGNLNTLFPIPLKDETALKQIAESLSQGNALSKVRKAVRALTHLEQSYCEFANQNLVINQPDILLSFNSELELNDTKWSQLNHANSSNQVNCFPISINGRFVGDAMEFVVDFNSSAFDTQEIDEFVDIFSTKFNDLLEQANERTFSASEMQQPYADARSTMQALIEKYEIPGAILGVQFNNQVQHVEAFGMADPISGTAMKPDSSYRIGSITKTFVAEIIMQLANEGKIDVTQKLGNYYSNGFLTSTETNAITVKSLLNYTSGISDYMTNPAFLGEVQAAPSRVWMKHELFKFASKDALGAEGQWNYSNTNFLLLKEVIENATGKKIGEVIEERILKPAGLDATFFPEDTSFVNDIITGYQRSSAGEYTSVLKEMHPSVNVATGNMCANTEDLLKWSNVLAKGTMMSQEAQLQRLDWTDVSKYFPGNLPVKCGLGIFSINGALGHIGMAPEFIIIMLHKHNTDVVIALNRGFSSTAEVYANSFMFYDEILNTIL